MKKEQFEQITEFQNKTFQNATSQSKLWHLFDEISEVFKALKENSNYKEEFADCFILLFGAANSAGMSYEDICKAIDDKMEINYKRKWGKPDINGVIKHIN